MARFDISKFRKKLPGVKSPVKSISGGLKGPAGPAGMSGVAGPKGMSGFRSASSCPSMSKGPSTKAANASRRWDLAKELGLRRRRHGTSLQSVDRD